MVATTTQIGDWARAVGGANARVHQILQPNTDPHEYEPRPADVEATAGAKLVLENGDDLDGWMGKVVSEAGGKPTVVDLGRGPSRAGDRARGVALRPALVARPDATRSPRSARSATRSRAPIPTHAQAYRRNAVAYVAKLRALDRSIAACFAKVPARSSGSSSPTTTPSATSPRATGSRSSGP